ncbi:MAG TPA: histidinol-phosphate transaminase [Burkholderiaceae bacterium]|nr:histidinol-phosphate transaminase [Burkholderiaceae bacterium]
MNRTLDQRLERVLRPDVREMRPYVVQPSAGLIKLDAMENPFRLPPQLQRVLGERLGAVAINRYPGERIDELKAALARHAGMPEGYAITLGNGSDELITLLGVACDRPGAVVLSPTPGFVMYEISCELLGLRHVGVPLEPETLDLDEGAMLAAIEEHQPAIVYIAYPNNPTGNLFDDAVIERIVEAAPGLVVVDEAYQPFASKSYLDRLTRHPHVLLMRTMSKFGLAGIRLGYLIGRPEIVGHVDKVRPPYNVSVLNCEAALFALEHEDEFRRQAEVLRRERDRLIEALAAMPGVHPFPSEANMILVRVPDPDTAFAGMKARGVLVKNVCRVHPLLAGCLRLTVGTPEENERMIGALRASLR